MDALKHEIFGGKPESHEAVPVPEAMPVPEGTAVPVPKGAKPSAPPLPFTLSEKEAAVLANGELRPLIPPDCGPAPQTDNCHEKDLPAAPAVTAAPSKREELQLLVAGLSEDDADLILSLARKQLAAQAMGKKDYAICGTLHFNSPPKHPGPDPSSLP